MLFLRPSISLFLFCMYSLPAFSAVSKSLVYVIHEDASYQYYVGNKRHNAAAEMFAGAKETARDCVDCEVFIFRFRPFSTGFCFMAKSDSFSYYYRNGKKINKVKRHRGSLRGDLVRAGSYYLKYSTADRSADSHFVFFGHQIPESEGQIYSKSYSDDTFSILQLAEGIKSFQRKFTAILLSSPESGTPYKISLLSPFSDYILASATNQGLPYLSLVPPYYAPITGGHSDEGYLEDLTQSVFSEMSQISIAPVSVVLYHTKKVSPYLQKILPDYLKARRTGPTVLRGQSRDCLSLSGLFTEDFDQGVLSYFQKGVWGKTSGPEQHSGWSCPP